MLRLSKKYIISISGFLVIVILALTAILLSIKINSSLGNFDKISDPNVYQAIFLSNDQIYFGHLKNADSDYMILTDVYYVKVNEDGVGQLVKLGQIEPHGPKDEMIINRDHILFWENLKSDSPVVNTIQGMQLQKK